MPLGGRARALLAGALAIAAAAPAATAQTGPKEMALVELEAPTANKFLLQATVPVPKGVYPRSDGKSPFAVRNSDGTLIPAQVEPVTWYPELSAGADVVEVIARLKTPPGTNGHGRVQYPLVLTPQPTAPPSLTPAVLDMLGQRDRIVLATRDVFGNDYRADLRRGKNGVKVLKSGRWLEETRFYEMLRPIPAVQGPTGTLNHMMGVHSYVTTRTNEDVITVSLRIHNGPSGLDKNDPLDDPNVELYFEDLRVLVPKGWVVLQAFPDPMLGSPYVQGTMMAHPIVKANPDGTMHVMPVQGQMHRRLAITKLGNEKRARQILDEEWRAFVKSGVNAKGAKLWSWWAALTPRWFTQNHPLPDLSHIGAANCRGKLTSDFEKIRKHMQAGTAMNAYPLHSPRLGWAHPWGVKYGGMTSGQEIYLSTGMTTAWGASKEGYRLFQLRHRMYTDRHPTVLFNKDGEPTSLYDWLQTGTTGQYVNMNFYMKPYLNNSNDPFGFKAAPGWQAGFVAANGYEPHYQSELFAHQNIDLQHLIRYTHSPKVLLWMGNDSLAKDDLRMQAELARMSYHRYYTSPNGGAIVSGMLSDMQWVQNHPREGFGFGRGEAWAVDVMSASWAMDPGPWRTQAKSWFIDVTNLVYDGQAACSGVIQAQIGSKLLGGKWRVRQSIEQAMVENALWGMKETVYRDWKPNRADQVEGILIKSITSMVNYPAWDATHSGPHAHLAVAPLNTTQKPYCGAIPPGGAGNGIDNYQTWSSFAYGYEMTGKKVFLKRALEMSGGASLRNALMGSKYNNLENRFALLALTERVSYP